MVEGFDVFSVVVKMFSKRSAREVDRTLYLYCNLKNAFILIDYKSHRFSIIRYKGRCNGEIGNFHNTFGRKRYENR